jgi:CRP-like cAMP-binding protein
MSIILNRYLTYQFAMSGDVIVRRGQVFRNFYIIKKGKVEVLAEDESTTIAILEEGTFFGEVAFFTNGKRSATVRAIKDCTFLIISREKFETILESFSEEKYYLKKVALQRKRTSFLKDLPIKREV